MAGPHTGNSSSAVRLTALSPGQLPSQSELEVLDLLLQFFADGALWLQHDFDHPDGSRCLVSALTHVRRKHGISGDGTGYYLLEFTLRAAGEVRAPQFGSAEGDLDPEMVAIAGAIIRQRTGDFDPSTYRDRYQSGNPAYWARPSVPLGYNEPVWPARAA